MSVLLAPKSAGVQCAAPIGAVSTCTSHGPGQPGPLDVTRMTFWSKVSSAIAPPSRPTQDAPPSVVILKALGPNTYPTSAFANLMCDTHRSPQPPLTPGTSNGVT